MLQESDTRPRNRFEISSSDGSGTGGLSLAAIVGIACAALVPLIATAGLLLWRWRYIQTTALSEAPVRHLDITPVLCDSPNPTFHIESWLITSVTTILHCSIYLVAYMHTLNLHGSLID